MRAVSRGALANESRSLCDDDGVDQRTVSVPAARLQRWIDGYFERHGGNAAWEDGVLVLNGADAATARLQPLFPMDEPHGNPVHAFVHHAATPPRCAVILVRRGGFAAAVVDDGAVEASDKGRRYVQGRTAAGGWSQQRFARRREKQANELVDAAATYAVEVVLPRLPIEYVVTGGDRALAQQVLSDPRLRPLQAIPRGPHLAVPDPRRDVLASLPALLTTVRIDLVDP